MVWPGNVVAFKKLCKGKLRAASLLVTINQAFSSCPDITSSSRGCPKNIPSVSDQSARQNCGAGSGFWNVGSVCSASCGEISSGSGHRRELQAAASFYICTQGGNWLSTNPLACSSHGAGTTSPTAGRFVAVPTPMSITAADQYCRQNYAALASIHSHEEQLQAAETCSSFANNDEAGTTIAGETAAYGGYGCWIGFDGSQHATSGYFWSDGSSIDYVNFAPGEPNAGNGPSSVTIDMRGPQGIVTSAGQARHGMWNGLSACPYVCVTIFVQRCDLNLSPCLCVSVFVYVCPFFVFCLFVRLHLCRCLLVCVSPRRSARRW